MLSGPDFRKSLIARLGPVVGVEPLPVLNGSSWANWYLIVDPDTGEVRCSRSQRVILGAVRAAPRVRQAPRVMVRGTSCEVTRQLRPTVDISDVEALVEAAVAKLRDEAATAAIEAFPFLSDLRGEILKPLLGEDDGAGIVAGVDEDRDAHHAEAGVDDLDQRVMTINPPEAAVAALYAAGAFVHDQRVRLHCVFSPASRREASR